MLPSPGSSIFAVLGVFLLRSLLEGNDFTRRLFLQTWEKILIANVMRWPLSVCTQERGIICP